jgi:ribosomal protein S18 acetylase RimI-like enzyme
MLRIKTLETLADAELISLKALLNQYGSYMYDELKLVAGKNSFSKQILNFPDTTYQKPDGGFLLATYNNIPAGCVGLRRFDSSSCEMKRMFVSTKFRGLRIGEHLCERVIALAKEYGYTRMLLDTNIEMTEAISLYLKSGFKEIPAYCENENLNPVYMEKIL